MTLQTDTLEQLQRKAMALGPVRTQQGGAAITAPGPAIAADSGVDVSAAIWAEVTVKPDAAGCIASILGRSTGEAAEFEAVGRGDQISIPAKGYKELVRCATLDEVLVVVDAMGSATSIVVTINPCLG